MKIIMIITAIIVAIILIKFGIDIYFAYKIANEIEENMIKDEYYE